MPQPIRRRRATLAVPIAAAYAVEALERRLLLSFAPVGPEFAVNPVITGGDRQPDLASDADGDVVVAWQSFGQDGSGMGIYARRYNASGVAQQVPGVAAGVTEFRVNTYTAGDQMDPAVAMDADGDFVVVWVDQGRAGPGDGYFQPGDVYAQRFDAAGAPVGSEFRVSTAAGANNNPAVAMDAGGDFVVAWDSNLQNDPRRVYARRYAASGAALGGEFRVSTFTGGQQTVPAVAMDAGGDFVIAWTSGNQDRDGTYGYGVYAKRYAAATGAERPPPPPLLGAGGAVGNEFRVHTTTANEQFDPSVAMGYGGGFAVAWTSNAGNQDVFTQSFDAAGLRADGEIRVNVTALGSQSQPDVAADADGDFLVTWTSVGEYGSSKNGVYARRFAAGGAADGGEVQTNTVTGNEQQLPAVAVDADGDFVVAWEGYRQTGSGWSVYARRYDQSGDTAGPIVSGVVAAGDRVEPGERLAAAVMSISLLFSENLSVAGGATGANSAINPANYRLTRDGADVSSLIASVSSALNAATRKYEAVLTFLAPLPDGAYVLTARRSLRDPAGNALDGNLDGVPDGDYSLPFLVHSIVRVGPEFRANGFTDKNQHDPSVAMDAAGDYVVVWTSGSGLAGPSYDVYACRYNAAGVPQQAPGQPAGTSEFLVNVFTAGNQGSPSVAMDADGDFVVAWDSNRQDGSGYGVYARRFNAAGVPQHAPGQPAGTSEFRVNTFTADPQSNPSVAMDADGDFVIAWDNYQYYGGSLGVYARRFNAAGVPQQVPGQPAGTSEFRLNALTTGNPVRPSVAMDAGGGFVVAWDSYGQDGGNDIYARRFDATGVSQQAPGQPAGTFEFRVNVFTAKDQRRPSAAMDADGDFVVAWQSYPQDGSGTGIYARRFDAAGVPQQAPGQPAGTSEFGVNVFTTDYQLGPSVAMDRDGDFVVAWDSNGQDGSGYGMYARRFDAAGVPQQAPGQPSGPSEFRVNLLTTDGQRSPSVATDADGDFLVAWQSYGQDGSGYGVYAQWYGPNQAPTTLGIPAVTVQQNEARTLRSLWIAFDDPNSPDSTLTFGVVGNTNPALFSSTAISNTTGTLALDYASAHTGQATLTVRATDPGGLSVDTSFTVTVSPIGAGAPVLNTIVAGDGTAQRSQVKQLTLTFDRAVTLAAGAVSLVRLNTGGSGANDNASPTDASSALAAPTTADSKTFVFTFLASDAFVQNGSLSDGIYRLNVDPAKVTSGGVAMAAAPAPFTFHRLFGDVTGSKSVDNADFGLFRSAFSKSTGQIGFDAAFDFDNNGTVNNIDFGQFRNRLGKAFT